MTETLFDRTVILQLDDVSYDGLDVEFKVKKTAKKALNEATITTWNVPERDYKAKIDNRNLRVRLLAGYSTPRLLFEGNPVDGGVTVERDNGDMRLKLECSDGLRTYRDARVQFSIQKQTTFVDVLDRIADQVGLPKGVIRVPSEKRWTQGIAYQGDMAGALDRLADAYDADWSIQNGKLQFLPKSETTRRGPLFSPELDNLLDVGSTDQGVKVKVLLDNQCDPGTWFKVDGTDDHDGTYKVQSVEYQGSSGHKENFYSIIEATPSNG